MSKPHLGSRDFLNSCRTRLSYPMDLSPSIYSRFAPDKRIVVHEGNCLDLLAGMPDGSMRLVVTSPPYNIGKEYEARLDLDAYVAQQAVIIEECVRVLAKNGSICWQVGNYVDCGSIVPLDTMLYPVFSGLGLKLRNRIIWQFSHGLHCKNRFSGRYETILWFTKSDDFVFNLDPVRVPQKYPGKKYFKGPNAGKYSCNPKGKNPGDVWNVPNVKSNHVEKTDHPCQYPVELIERLVLSMTNEGDWVLDPFLGTGTSIIAALRHGRRGVGAEIMPSYVRIAKDRIEKHLSGDLRVRPMGKPVYNPEDAGKSLTTAPWARGATGNPRQLQLLEADDAYLNQDIDEN